MSVILPVNQEYIVSIDVGIKNLAICVFNKQCTTSDTPCIKEWTVLNIGNASDGGVVQKSICALCKNKAKYGIVCSDETSLYCNKHAKASETFIMPAGDYTLKKIKKYKLAELVERLEPFVKPSTPRPKTKKDWTDYYHSIVLAPLTDGGEVVSASEISLIDVSRILAKKLDVLFASYITDICTVLIENQISPIANRMKSIQSMITQYFVMRSPEADIQYVSSTHKLEDVDVETYSQRKKAGIVKCVGLLTNVPDWVKYISTHKKKDDLADCFLQGHWFICK
jgi:hypothetical protein